MSKKVRVRLRSDVGGTPGSGPENGSTLVDLRVVITNERSSIEVRKLVEQAIAEICVQLGIPQ